MEKYPSAEAILVQQVVKCIPTGSRRLDAALGQGLRLGTILEVTGAGGTGKTQLAMQLMVNTVMPAPLGMIDGKVLFISTRKSFLEQRVNQLVDSCVNIWNKTSEKLDPKDRVQLTRNCLLERIQHKMIFSLFNLISTVYQLVELAKPGSNVRLIVIDSFATHFMSLMPSEEARIVCELIEVLESVAIAAECAIVLTNDLTTDSQGSIGQLKPALGDFFHHLMPQRIFLAESGDDDGIIANVQKNLCRGPSLVKILINADGVRDG